MLSLILLTLALADRAEVVIADFEAPTYGRWTVTGDAFGPGPAKGALPGQMAVAGYEGERLVNSFFHGDDTIGSLTSPEFTIDRKFVRFLIGGGRFPGEACMNLVIDGKAVRTATGHESEFLRAASWDVTEFAGKTAKIEILDRRKGGWGHLMVDQIVLCDYVPTPVDDRAGLLAKAEASTKAAAERASKDPLRPTFHVLPPGNWMNDPNGPIFYKGYYHLFYQYNPYGDDWGNMHWGHVRSKDLAHWERMPIALWPSKSLGEEHVFSGCAAVNLKGELMLFYTSIGSRKPEQWVALPDSDDLALWKKHPANPILTEDLHGDVKVHEWRDPFLFKNDGKTYMVLGGNLNANKGGQGVVNVYRAENDSLTKWTYLGVLFTHPDKKVANVECPLFFPLGDKWVLITSQGRPVHWFVGTLDPKTLRFTAEHRGAVDLGSVYAPNVTTASDGRTLFWGWVQDFPKGRGWNGCLTLPRTLALTPDGDLSFSPARELEALRGTVVQTPGGNKLEDRSFVIKAPSDAIEMRVRLSPGNSKLCGIRLRKSEDGNRSIPITYSGNTLDVAGTKLKLEVPPTTNAMTLRIFLDRSVLEVYTHDGQVVTRVLADSQPGDTNIEFFASGGWATFWTSDIWPMKSTWLEDGAGR